MLKSGQQRVEKRTQKMIAAIQEAEELPQIKARSGKQRVAAVSGATFEPVAAQQTVVFRVADDRLDHRPSFQPAFDFVGDAAFLPGDKHSGARMARETMPLVSLIDRDA